MVGTTCRIRTYVRNWGMTMTAPLAAPASRPARVEELQARIRGLQATRLDSKAVPTHPALESVLPGGTLREGTVVQVEGSTTLLMALLAGPSASGRWLNGVANVASMRVLTRCFLPMPARRSISTILL